MDTFLDFTIENNDNKLRMYLVCRRFARTPGWRRPAAGWPRASACEPLQVAAAAAVPPWGC